MTRPALRLVPRINPQTEVELQTFKRVPGWQPALFLGAILLGGLVFLVTFFKAIDLALVVWSGTR